MNCAIEKTSADPSAGAAMSNELELTGSEDLPRRLFVEASRGRVSARIYPPLRKRNGIIRSSFASLAYSYADPNNCSILVRDDRRTLLIGDAGFPLCADEAKKLIERFGFREWS